MKKLIALVFVLFLFGNCQSQSNYEDVVYLKNGSIIHGIIIEQVPGISIKIKNHSDDVFFYKIDEVEKMTKEEPIKTSPPQPKKEEIKEQPKVQTKRVWGFDSVRIKTNGIIEIGGLFGVAENYHIKVAENPGTSTNPTTRISRGSKVGSIPNMFDLKIVIDKMFNRRLSIGGGLGLDISKTDPISTISPTTSIYLPGFIDIRYSFLKKRVSPYLASQVGASFYKGDQYTGKIYGGGASATMQIGCKVFASPKVSFMMALGYRFQEITYRGIIQYTDNNGNNTIQATSNFNVFVHYVTLNWGVAF